MNSPTRFVDGSCLFFLLFSSGIVFGQPAQDSPPAGPITRLGGHNGAVFSIAFAPNGNNAVTYGNDFALRRWNLLKQKQEHEWSPGAHHFALAFSTSGQLFVSGDSAGVLRAWEPIRGRLVGSPLKHEDGIKALAISPTDKQLVSASADGMIRVWNLKTGAKERELKHEAAANSVAFSPDGNFVLFGGEDKMVRLWDLKNDRLERQLEGHTEPVFHVAFSPDGKRALSAGGIHPNSGRSDGKLRIWDVSSLKLLREINAEKEGNLFRCATFSRDGKRALAGYADGGLTLWDLESGKRLVDLKGHTDGVNCVAIAPDGRRALSGGEDNTVRYWQLPAP